MEKLPHQLLIEEKGIDIRTLPLDIKGKLKGINMLLGRKDPTANTIATVKKQSVVISDNILSFLESGLPSKEKVEQEEAARLLAEAEEAEKIRLEQEQRDQEAEAEREESERLEAERVAKVAADEQAEIERVANLPESRIKAALNSEGKIHAKVVQEILGHVPSNTFTEFGMRFRRGMMSNWYTVS